MLNPSLMTPTWVLPSRTTAASDTVVCRADESYAALAGETPSRQLDCHQASSLCTKSELSCVVTALYPFASVSRISAASSSDSRSRRNSRVAGATTIERSRSNRCSSPPMSAPTMPSVRARALPSRAAATMSGVRASTCAWRVRSSSAWVTTMSARDAASATRAWPCCST